MPLIKNFRSTNIWNAFILNSIAAAIVIVIGITVKDHFDTYTKDDSKITRKTNFTSISLTVLFTFLTSFLAYTIMYLVFGFGGGMLEC